MRNPELSRSQQVIISAVFSAAISATIVLAVLLYQGFTGAWNISTTSLMTAMLVITLAQLLKEIIQTLRASERQSHGQEDRWIIARGDTLPHAAMPAPMQNGRTTLRSYL